MKEPLVEVTWRDAAHYGRGGWVSNVEQCIPVMATTVGYLVKKTKTEIRLAMTWSEELGQWGGVWVIPREWAMKIRKLK